MTENEAVNKIRYRINTASDIAGNGADGKAFEDLEMAIKAIEELKQYRAIGTVEEFKALKEKAEPKKPIRKLDINGKYEEVTCPNCGRFVDDYTNKKYCNCGQVLGWQ